MPEEFVLVSSCPICLGPEEVPSMVMVEIDRMIPKGRTAILLCRSCVGAVMLAARELDEPLADPLHPFSEAMTEAPWSSDTWSAVAEIYGAFGDDPAWLKEQLAREKEERDDDPSTD